MKKMLKRLKKWRSNLTVTELHQIMWRVGIVTEICITLFWFLNRNELRKEVEELPIWMLWFITSMLMLFAIEVMIYTALQGMIKEIKFQEEQIEEKFSQKLKEGETIEVYLEIRCRRNVNQMILDVYDLHSIRYFAMRKGNESYIIAKENDKVLKEYRIRNWVNFEASFTFTKEKD